MTANMTAQQLATLATEIAKNHKTLYVMGCFGAPLNAKNKARYTSNHTYNKQQARKDMINGATADTFGFDCCGLIKGILWGWNGNAGKTYGGATYVSNGVPDISADGIIAACKDVSTDFSEIEIGEAVWVRGHIGIYIGDGLVVESSPKWKNCVQITACNHSKNGYKRRNWTKHGKLPYVTYGKEEAPKVGDVVIYNGTKHYASANDTTASACKGGKAKITAIHQLGKSKHPYHLVRVSGSGSTVYGWVDAGTFSKI